MLLNRCQTTYTARGTIPQKEKMRRAQNGRVLEPIFGRATAVELTEGTIDQVLPGVYLAGARPRNEIEGRRRPVIRS